MKQNILGLFLTLTIAAALFSCKKETALPAETALTQPVKEKLQNWYTGQTAKGQPDGDKIKFFLNAGTPDWENAKQIGNTFIAPVIINDNKSRGCKFLVTNANSDGSLASGKYIYVLKNKGAEGTALSCTVLNEILTAKKANPDFSGAIVEYDLKHELISSKSFVNGKVDPAKVENVNFKFQSNKFTAQKVGGGDITPNYVNPCEGGVSSCIDWFWQTYVGGVLVNEEYLYTSCYCSSGGGGAGSGTACAQQNEIFVNQGTAISGAVTSVDNFNNGTIWIKSYNWPIFTAGTWGLLSYEKGTMEKIQYPNNIVRWEYQSFVHIRITEAGVVIGGTRTFQDLDNIINLTSTRTSAYVQIAFSVSSKTTCTLGTPITIPYNANKTFHAPNSVVYIPES
jgi:hypothetical protein